MTDARIRSVYLPLAVGVLLLAAGLRLHDLGTQSLWHDEGNSYVQATRSLAEIADNAGRDIHPPGYYWLLAVWTKLAGTSEFGLRSLSAFASIVSVAVAIALGKRLYAGWVGLAAGAFVALNTFSIYYAQEARMYALLAMWSAAALWVLTVLLERVARGDDARWWAVALGLVNAAGMYTQYAFPFVVLAEVALVILWALADAIPLYREHGLRGRLLDVYREPLRALLWFGAAGIVALIVYAPWLPTAWRQVTTWPNTGEEIPLGEAGSTILSWFAFGITAQGGITAAAAFFLLFGLLNLPDSRPRGRGWRHVWRLLVPVLWVAATAGSFLALGLFREANLKFLLPAQIGFALWLARGAWVLWTLQVRRDAAWARMVPRLAAGAGMLALIVGMWDRLDPLYTDAAYQRDDYRAIAAEIMADGRAGDAIVLSAPNQQEVFGYYYDGPLPVYALPRGLGGDDPATLAETRDVIADHNRVFAVLWGTSERDPNNVVESTLDAEAFEADSRWFGDVRLVRYATPVDFGDAEDSGAQFGEYITLVSYAISETTLRPGDVLQLHLVWRTDAPLDVRYKVFVQLLDEDGFLLPGGQRDAEPGGGLALTTTWQPGEPVIDNHALIIPHDLAPSNYVLIIGLYNLNDPQARLTVSETARAEDGGDTLPLATITVADS